MVGWVRLRVAAPPARRCAFSTPRCSTRRGTSTRRTCARARRRDSYTLKGGGAEIFEPHFTFHGFRFVKVEGFPARPRPRRSPASSCTPTCRAPARSPRSDTMLNQLYHNIVWGQKGNFVGVPTDCPQRDERLGWTGDAQVFSRTAAFNYRRRRLLHELAGRRRRRPARERLAPRCHSRRALARHAERRRAPPVGATRRSSCRGRCTLPMATCGCSSGNTRACARTSSISARRPATSCSGTRGWHYGDWLAFATIDADYPGATTDKDLIATAFFAHSTDLLARAARRRSARRKTRATYRRSVRAHPRGVDAGVRHGFGPRRLQHADGVRARAAVPSRPRRAARRRRQRLAANVRADRSPHDGLPRHAVSHGRAHREGPSRRRVRAAAEQEVSVVAVSDHAGRDDDLGALGRPEARQHVPGRRA